MLWNPLGFLPKGQQRLLWLAAACALAVARGPDFLASFEGRSAYVPDFFQEYASARNWWEGLPVYTYHQVTLPRYLGTPMDPQSPVVINAHPPTSVLLAIPFVGLKFESAFLIWDSLMLAMLLASVILVARGLNIPLSIWSMPPALAFLLICFPFWDQVHQGQLNPLLLLLLTGTWAAERSGRTQLAGVLLATAVSIKLFPAFLFLYFAMRRRWDVVVSGLIVLVALTALTAGVLGEASYVAYVRDAIPEFQWFRGTWANASFLGFWSRLFDPSPEKFRTFSMTHPIWYSPTLARAGTLISSIALTVALAAVTRRGATREQNDRTFGLAMTAMVLVAPIVWQHYFLLLLLPLAVAWRDLPPTKPARAILLAIVVALGLWPERVWGVIGLVGHDALPIHALGVLSYQFFALLALFALGFAEARGYAVNLGGPRRWMAFGAVVMLAAWANIIIPIWQRHGLFSYLAGDFGIYRTIAVALVSEGPTAMYDLERITAHMAPLRAYYGPDSGPLNVGPGPYPAAYILPFTVLAAFSPPLGFLIWTLINLALVIAVARRLAARFPERSWGLIASAVLFFPVVYSMFFGQLAILMLFGLDRAFRAFEDDREFQAGLWCGLLLLKPQYVVFLTLVFLYKRRWRALGGLAVAGLGGFVSSFAIVGAEGFRAYLATLRLLTGFQAGHPIIHPETMINWRGLLINFLPSDVSEGDGFFYTAVLSVLTTCSLLVIWRAKWNPRDDRFAARFLATLIVTMMATLHNHIHGAALLLVPGMALAARGGGPWPLPALLLIGVYAPPLVFAVTGSATDVS